LIYKLNLDGRSYTVDLEIDTKEKVVTLSSSNSDLNHIRFEYVDENTLFLFTNNRVIPVYFMAEKEITHIQIEGRIFSVTEKREHDKAQGRRIAFRRDADGNLSVPMPSVISNILVKEGDTVKKGDSLIIANSMKMETTLSAPFDGIIKKIHVKEGSKVSPRQTLIEIESSGDG